MHPRRVVPLVVACAAHALFLCALRQVELSGSSTLDIGIGRDGRVVVTVEHAEGDMEGWARVADAVRKTVDPQSVRIPPSAGGWHVVVRLESKVQFADGRDVRSVHGLRGAIATSALQSALQGKPWDRGTASVRGGPDHDPGGAGEPPPVGGALGRRGSSNAAAGALQSVARLVLPTPTVSISGKVCSATLGVTPLGIGIGGSCSLENIGTGTTRVVSGRIVSEGPF